MEFSKNQDTAPETHSESDAREGLGTFTGVFVPGMLTLLGVIMYLRLGWVVGNAGLGDTILIILIGAGLTVCTGLSMASVATNIRIGSGGGHFIVWKSLGVEAAGSAGVTLYLAQTLSFALSITGFTEGWCWLFPGHSHFTTSVVVWAVLMFISFFASRIVFRIQYLIMAIIGISILSLALTHVLSEPLQIPVSGFAKIPFWTLFAVFFPAMTGFMVGTDLSRGFKKPGRAIPLGITSVILVTTAIYMLLAWTAARRLSVTELRLNEMVFIENALSSSAAITGLFAAALFSAMGSMISASRVLQSLAEQQTIPAVGFFSKRSGRGESLNTLAFTGMLAIVAVSAGDLNELAILITLFYLVTFGALNLLVLIQQNMNMINFRPTFRTPQFVPLAGVLGCLIIPFFINPLLAVVALAVVALLYSYLAKRVIRTGSGDVRGGMFLALADKASSVAARFPRHQISWKPDLLIPIEDPANWGDSLMLIRDILNPSGSIYAFSVKDSDTDQVKKQLDDLLSPLRDHDIQVGTNVLNDRQFLPVARLVIQTLKSGVSRPNTLFLTIGGEDKNDTVIHDLIDAAASHEMSVMILNQYHGATPGQKKDINLWLRDESPNWHLATLIALRLQMNWNGALNLITVAPTREESRRLYGFLERLGEQLRLPAQAEFHVMAGAFSEALARGPRADINIFGLARDISFEFMRKTSAVTKSSCLYITDSRQT
jgi:solute carrier family 12 (sodium/potassium/chloride transporter), member 2